MSLLKLAKAVSEMFEISIDVLTHHGCWLHFTLDFFFSWPAQWNPTGACDDRHIGLRRWQLLTGSWQVARCTYVGALLIVPRLRNMHFPETWRWRKEQPCMQFWLGTLSFNGVCGELTVVFSVERVCNGIILFFFFSLSHIFMSVIHFVSFVHTNLTSSCACVVRHFGLLCRDCAGFLFFTARSLQQPSRLSSLSS